VLFGLAEIERETMLERQAHGIGAARATQERAQEMYADGYSFAHISLAVHRGEEIVKRMVSAPAGKLWWGQDSKQEDPRNLRRARRDVRIRVMVGQGLTTQEIGNALGCSRRTVVSRIGLMGGYGSIKKNGG